MKVCKVVVNSVSHDARVLKEAEAVREAGFEVVIIGIQDANNSVPIQLLDNGVVIRRVAWQSTAFRPPIWTYVLQIVALFAAVIGGASLIYWLHRNVAQVLSIVTFANAVYLASAAVLAYFTVLIWKNFKRRKASFLNIKKREQNELLKYDAEFSAYRRAQIEQLASEDPLDSPESPAQEMSSDHPRWSLPRPRRLRVTPRRPTPTRPDCRCISA